MGEIGNISNILLYKYQPLDGSTSIRLLTLLPSQDPYSDIEIKLSITPLDEAPDYEALSYTWATSDGDTSISSSVICEGARIMVTRNCVDFLRLLRRQGHERVLWMDAIVIDQGNITERSQQVLLMGDVYNRAARVVIWLGDASKTVDPETGSSVSDFCLDYMTALAAELRVWKTNGGELPMPPLQDKLTRLGADYVENGLSCPLLQGVLDVVLRPWWTRCWVVQEAALAESAVVICGVKTASYADLYTCFTELYQDNSHNAGMLWSLLDGYKSHMQAVWYVKDMVKHVGPARAFRRVLMRSRRLRATDKRDHIYAVLDTFGSFKSDLPFPDYARSTAEVFADMTEKAFRMLGSLDILADGTNTGESPELPSWVPDFSSYPEFHVPANPELFNACGTSNMASYRILNNGKELMVQGKCFDMLKYQPKAELRAYKNPYIAAKGILGYQQSCKVGLSLTRYPTGEDIKEVLWRTLCWNVDVHVEYPAEASLGPSFDEFYEALFSGKAIEEIEKDLLSEGAHSFNDICVHSMPLGITETGYLASAPWTAQEGDVIVLFAGAHLPFVLRKAAEQDKYKMVGACYVHGIMDGEAFPKNEAELEWFVIK